MNGSGKQSFYEIQLNNSSLIAAFLVAVALGVAVFMLGVMVGRGQAPAPPSDGGWVEAPLAADDAESTAEGEDAADEGIDPEFFDKVQETDDGAVEPSTVAETSPESTPEPEEGEDAGGQEEVADPPAATPEGVPAADPSLPPGNGWVVQVKATPARSEADELQAALASAGFDAFIEETVANGATMYRVRVGRYRDEADARRAESALSQRPDVSTTWVTRG